MNFIDPNTASTASLALRSCSMAFLHKRVGSDTGQLDLRSWVKLPDPSDRISHALAQLFVFSANLFLFWGHLGSPGIRCKMNTMNYLAGSFVLPAPNYGGNQWQALRENFLSKSGFVNALKIES
jgi:hypothetical protein